ncbi:ABC transporter ATP-binding protein [Pseudonocardia eucalypti]|uniref:ABC transporter ATP-binding protein n=1 Tax=Pseudonocardia eucalypti TaxID=648755 RepID=A0ABP9RB70_9PSEU|nr:ABC-type multidrug transport system fused ATPase/permease subunit [Pseudonocardia eucalypti]
MSESSVPGTPGEVRLRLGRDLVNGRWGTCVLIGVLMLVSVAATLALPLVVTAMIEAVQRNESLTGVGVVMVAVGLGAAVAGALSTNLLCRLGEGLVARLRTRVVEHALRMRPGDVRAEGSGNIAGRLGADAMQIRAATDIVPLQLPMAVLTLTGTLVMMGLLDWVLLLVTISGFSVAVILVIGVIAMLRLRYRAMQERLGALMHRFVGTLEALTVIKSTRSEAWQSARLASDVEELRRVAVSGARYESLMVPVINLGQQVALLTVLISGGARLASDALSLPHFVGFLLYLFQLTAPLVMAASGLSTVQAGMTAKGRFEDLLRRPTEAAETLAGTDRPAPAATEPVVRLDRVTAGYGSASPALRDVSFQVPAVGLTALVGPSGSGKTTVLRLAERLLTAESGAVRVFGHDVRGTDLDDLRSRIAYVDQDSTLLPDTVRTNLRLGLAEPRTDAELFAALAKVGMAADVRDMPEGLDTELLVGRGLSGGQCQRLALARALLSEAPLLLLDEPTSALDAANEHRLRAVIADIARERAVLVVAHRLSTVREADHVIVLDGGRVRGEGSHAELLAGCDLYAELVRLQLGERELAGVNGAPK